MQGEYAAARAGAEAALREAEAAGDELLALRVRVEQADLGLGVWTADEVLRVGEAAVAAFERANDDRSLSRAWVCVGNASMRYRVQCERAREASMRASECAERAGDSGRYARAGATLAAWIGPMPVPAAIDFTRELLVPGPGPSVLRAHRDLAVGMLEATRGRFDEARLLLASAVEILRRAGFTAGVAATTDFQADVEWLAGDPVAAERLLRPAYERAERLGEVGTIGEFATYLVRVLYEKGDYEGAEHFVTVLERVISSDDIASTVPMLTVRAELLARQGSFEEAETLARGAVALSEPTDSPRYKGDALMDLAEVLALAGRAEEAAATVLLARELYERKGALACVARADRRLAQLR
jgi:tetratricopeptide (TPR) repeat protein